MWGANSAENLELEAQLQMLADTTAGSGVYISNGDIRKAIQEVLDSLVRWAAGKLMFFSFFFFLFSLFVD